ncbi:MAG: hypothetical protein Tsb008_07620 [Rhodothalassiaceae bacterium]
MLPRRRFVPTARAFLPFLLSALAMPGIAHADPVAAIAACRAIRDDAARLVCYDRIAPDTPDETTRTDKMPTPRNDPTQDDTGATTPVEDRFGFAPRPEPGQTDEVRKMEVAAVRKTLRGALILTMTNGQVWQQTDSTRLPAITAGMEARIEKGAIGSFLLTVNGRSFRAKRSE